VHTLPSNDGKCSATDDEAAYWAAYSAVQGSADSTIPSRVPSSRKLNAHCSAVGAGNDSYPYHYRQCDSSYDGYNDAYDEPIAVEQVRSRWDGLRLDELDLASSAAAADGLIGSGHGGGKGERILGRFSPEVEDREKERERRLSEEQDASDATALARALFPVASYREYLENLEGQQNQPRQASAAQDTKSIAVPSLDHTTEVLPHFGNTSGDLDITDAISDSAEQLSPSESTAVPSETEIMPPATAEGAVAEAVRGVYRLWLNHNQSATDISVAAGRSKEEAFLALVASAISSV
jgi:hypothetical protein